MKVNNFWVQLILVGVAFVLPLYLTSLINPLVWHSSTVVILLIFFTLFSIFAYYITVYAAKQKNKNVFLQIVMALTFFKTILAFLVAYLIVENYEISSITFLAIFIWAYILYTVYEVRFLMKNNQLKAQKSNT